MSLIYAWEWAAFKAVMKDFETNKQAPFFLCSSGTPRPDLNNLIGSSTITWRNAKEEN